MLCEKCQTREARVKITRVINGISETHNYCPECAGSLKILDQDSAPGWSNMIFKLLSDVVGRSEGEKAEEPDDQKLRALTCPKCQKTYGAFLEDGMFGCEDCYEVFGPYINRTILSIQGASVHSGKRSGEERKAKPRIRKNIADEVLTPEEEKEMLRIKLQEAVSIEDYDTAIVLRDQLKALEKTED